LCLPTIDRYKPQLVRYHLSIGDNFWQSLVLCSLKKSAAHSSRTLLRGGSPNPAVLKKEPRQSKSFSSRKNSFALPRPNCISPATLPEYLYEQNPKEKCPFLFQEKSVARKSEKQGTFFFGVAE